MGGIFLYGGTTGIMSCLIFDHFKYFLENNIFQHYYLWFYFIYLFSLCHGAHTYVFMYIGNGDLFPGVLYVHCQWSQFMQEPKSAHRSIAGLNILF